MAVGSGLSAQVGIETEATVQTPAVVSRFVEIDNETLGLKRTIAQGQGLHNSLYRRDARRVEVAREAAGDVSFDTPTNGIGKFLQHMLGSFSTTATVLSGAAYQQIHNPGSLQGKTCTVQKGVPDTTGYVHPFTYPGAKITGWEFTAAQGGLLKAKLTFDAADEATESQAVAPTTLAASCLQGATTLSTVASVPVGSYVPVDVGALVEYVSVSAVSGSGPYTLTVAATKYAHASGVPVGSGQTVYNTAVKLQTAVYGAATGLFSFKDAHLVFGGTTSVVSGLWTNTGGVAMTPANGFVVRNVDLKGSNPLNVARFAAGSKTKAEQLENNFRDLTGSLDVEYSTRLFYDAYQQDQGMALVLNFANQDAPIVSGVYPTLRFYLPLINFEDGASPQIAGPDVVLQKIAFTAQDDGVNGTVQAYLISTDTTV